MSEISRPKLENHQPTGRELSRLIERRAAQELEIELLLAECDAAGYIGLCTEELVRLAQNGEIPAYPVPGPDGDSWCFYPSDLDAWLL